MPERDISLQVLRLDRCHAQAPGNKAFKLQYLLDTACESGEGRVLSFGGAWSNHLHALAALGASRGLQTVGLVRGENLVTPTLREAAAWGMELHALTRTEYRARNDANFQLESLQRFGPGLLIPEGGDCADGARGCLPIGRAIAERFPSGATVVLATGTGTTLAGIVAGLERPFSVLGVSALKGALDTKERVAANLLALGVEATAQWRICHEFHCGGFARVTPELQDCIFRADGQGLPLEPVYTGKALLAVLHLLARGEFDRSLPLVLVHTGGLQGRRGFSWLEQ